MPEVTSPSPSISESLSLSVLWDERGLVWGREENSLLHWSACVAHRLPAWNSHDGKCLEWRHASAQQPAACQNDPSCRPSYPTTPLWPVHLNPTQCYKLSIISDSYQKSHPWLDSLICPTFRHAHPIHPPTLLPATFLCLLPHMSLFHWCLSCLSMKHCGSWWAWRREMFISDESGSALLAIFLKGCSRTMKWVGW